MATSKTGNPILDKLANITSLGGLLPSGQGVDPTSLFYKSLIGMGQQVPIAIRDISSNLASLFPKAQSTATQSYLPPPPPPPTPPPPAPKPTGGGGGITTGAGTIAGQGGAGTGTDPYAQAIAATQAQVPLIQQRYQALLDEISRSTAESQKSQEQATTSSIGEQRARAAAQGVYGGTTELGTETNIRNQAASAIRNIQESGASQKAQATAQEAIDIGQVTKDLANLAISKNKSDQDAYQFALEYILKKKQVDIEAQKAASSGASTYPINIPGYGTVNVGGSTALSYLTKQGAAQTETANKLGEINTLVDLLGKHSATTGLIGYPITQALQLTGLSSDEQNQLTSLMSLVRSGELFTIGGKTLTATERAELTPYLPSPAKTASQNIANLNILKNKLTDIYSNYSGQSLSDGSVYLEGL